jgi:hypothetical protein
MTRSLPSPRSWRERLWWWLLSRWPGAVEWRRQHEGLADPATRQQPTYDPYPLGPNSPPMRVLVVTKYAAVTVDLDGYSLDDFKPLLYVPTNRLVWFLERLQMAREKAEAVTAQREREKAAAVDSVLSTRARTAARDPNGRFIRGPSKPERYRSPSRFGSPK